jgi:citrate lyase beta subunit
VSALSDAWSGGRGAVNRNGVMIDEATVRMARSLLASAERIEQRKTKTDGV